MTNKSVEEALLRIRTLPTLPTVLSRILVTVGDPGASALDLGQHIASDQSLSAALLKLVNSAYYGFYRQIKSVTHAIVMLGFLEVRNLALTATAFRTLADSSSGYDRIQLWKHSFATALAAERIAKALQMKGEGVFEAGLLHDLGKVALDMLFPQEFRSAAREAHARGVLLVEPEREIFGLDHARAGGALGEHWNLPPSVVEAIASHHDPTTASIEPALSHLVALADQITYQAELGESGNGKAPDFPAASAQALAFSQDKLPEIVDAVAAERPRIEEVFASLA